MSCACCKSSYCSTCSPQMQSGSSFWEDARGTLAGALRDIERAKVQIANEMSVDLERLRSFFNWTGDLDKEKHTDSSWKGLGPFSVGKSEVVADNPSGNIKDKVTSCCTTTCRKPQVHVIMKDPRTLMQDLDYEDLDYEETPWIIEIDDSGAEEQLIPDQLQPCTNVATYACYEDAAIYTAGKRSRGRTLERAARRSRRSRTPPTSCRSMPPANTCMDHTRPLADQAASGIAHNRIASREKTEKVHTPKRPTEGAAVKTQSLAELTQALVREPSQAKRAALVRAIAQ